MVVGNPYSKVTRFDAEHLTKTRRTPYPARRRSILGGDQRILYEPTQGLGGGYPLQRARLRDQWRLRNILDFFGKCPPVHPGNFSGSDIDVAWTVRMDNHARLFAHMVPQEINR